MASDIVADAKAWLEAWPALRCRAHYEGCHAEHTDCLIERLVAEVERHRMTPEERNAVERAAEGYCEVVANIKLAVHGGDGRDKYAFTDDVLTDLENYMKRTA